MFPTMLRIIRRKHEFVIFCKKQGHYFDQGPEFRKQFPNANKSEFVAYNGTRYITRNGKMRWSMDSGCTDHMVASSDIFKVFRY